MDQASLEHALVEQQQVIQQLRAREDSAAISSAIDAHLGATPIVDGGRGQLEKLLAPSLVVVRDAHGLAAVVAPGGTPMADWLRGQLDGPCRHFVRTNAPAAAGGGAPAAPVANEGSLLGRLIAMNNEARARENAGGPAAVNMALPFGLSSRR